MEKSIKRGHRVADVHISHQPPKGSPVYVRILLGEVVLLSAVTITLIVGFILYKTGKLASIDRDKTYIKADIVASRTAVRERVAAEARRRDARG